MKGYQMKLHNMLVIAAIALLPLTGHAGKRGGGAPAPGTGSKSSSTHVSGHIKKDGTYVEGHRRSTPDQKFENNWTTKGNDNLYTGKDGTRVNEPAKR
jgi:hypothetical protein